MDVATIVPGLSKIDFKSNDDTTQFRLFVALLESGGFAFQRPGVRSPFKEYGAAALTNIGTTLCRGINSPSREGRTVSLF